MASLRTRRVSGSILQAPRVPVVEHYPRGDGGDLAYRAADGLPGQVAGHPSHAKKAGTSGSKPVPISASSSRSVSKSTGTNARFAGSGLIARAGACVSVGEDRTRIPSEVGTAGITNNQIEARRQTRQRRTSALPPADSGQLDMPVLSNGVG